MNCEDVPMSKAERVKMLLKHTYGLDDVPQGFVIPDAHDCAEFVKSIDSQLQKLGVLDENLLSLPHTR